MKIDTMKAVGILALLHLVSKSDSSVVNQGLLLSFNLVFFNGGCLFTIERKVFVKKKKRKKLFF